MSERSPASEQPATDEGRSEQRAVETLYDLSDEAVASRTHAPPSPLVSVETTDTQRLDWLEQHGHSLMFYGNGKWDVHAGMVKPSPREAIDAAIEFFAREASNG